MFLAAMNPLASENVTLSTASLAFGYGMLSWPTPKQIDLHIFECTECVMVLAVKDGMKYGRIVE
jgi:hypothetical protein